LILKESGSPWRDDNENETRVHLPFTESPNRHSLNRLFSRERQSLAKLIIYEAYTNTGTVFETFELVDNRILIGSDPECQLILDVPDIDPMHASLELRDHHWFLQDLGGPGGTAVNGRLIEGPTILRHNEMIEVGVVKMRFVTTEPGVTAAMPPMEPDEDAAAQVSGRVWFATLTGFTVLILLAIGALLLLAYSLGIFTLSDLLPFGG